MRRLGWLAGGVVVLHLLLLLGLSGPRILPPARGARPHPMRFELARGDDPMDLPASGRTTAERSASRTPGQRPQGPKVLAGAAARATEASAEVLPEVRPEVQPVVPPQARRTAASGRAGRSAGDGPEAGSGGTGTGAGTPAATALRLPAPQTLVYDMAGLSRGVSLAGEAVLAWRHDGQQYEAQLAQRWASGQREMRSAGRLTAVGLAPLRFGDRTSGRGEQAAHFDTPKTKEGDPSPDGPRVRFSGNQPEAELPAGAQDRLSVMLQLAARVAGLGRPPREGDQLEFPVATARSAALWRFRFEGSEWMPGPGTERETLRWRRRPEGPHDLDIEVWLAPDLDYLPLQWRLTQDNGDWLEQRWTGDYRP